MNVAVIFEGGVGRRMNNAATPKQFLKLHGKEIIIHTLEKFNDCPQIDAITIACVEPWIAYLRQCVNRYDIKKIRTIVPGGSTGQESIYRALLSVEEYSDPDSIVLIHDGVRPLIDVCTIQKNIECVKSNRSAITVAAAIETVVQVDSPDITQGRITQISDRSICRLARAPQSFYLEDILWAHRQALKDGKNDFIDSASIMKFYGFDLFVVDGPIENIKITTPSDYYAFKAYYEASEDSQVFGI